MDPIVLLFGNQPRFSTIPAFILSYICYNTEHTINFEREVRITPTQGVLKVAVAAPHYN